MYIYLSNCAKFYVYVFNYSFVLTANFKDFLVLKENTPSHSLGREHWLLCKSIRQNFLSTAVAIFVATLNSGEVYNKPNIKLYR